MSAAKGLAAGITLDGGEAFAWPLQWAALATPEHSAESLGSVPDGPWFVMVLKPWQEMIFSRESASEWESKE